MRFWFFFSRRASYPEHGRVFLKEDLSNRQTLKARTMEGYPFKINWYPNHPPFIIKELHVKRRYE